MPIFAWTFSLIALIFLKRSLVFPILLFPSISLHWSNKMALLCLLVIFWNSAFSWVYLSFFPLLFISLLLSPICKASSDSHFALHFFFGGMVFFFFNFTILCWFCHTLAWIHYGFTCVPHPEHPSHLPSHPIPLGHPSAPALSTLSHASNLDWRFISYMII